MGWLRERWIPLFVLATLTFSIALVGHIQSQQYGQPDTAHGGQNSSAERANPVPVPVGQAMQTPSTPESQQEINWETRDQKAQVSMMWAAWAAVAMTFLGLYLVARTLHYTGRAAKSANDTLRVAQDTLEATLQSTRLELQPYLSIELLDVAFPPAQERPALHKTRFAYEFKVTIKITNTGKTPAENIFINAGSKATVLIRSRKRHGAAPSLVDFNVRSVDKSQSMSTMGQPSLSAGDHFTRELTPCAYVDRDEFANSEVDPLDAVARFAFALRVSFTDNFTEQGVGGKRYQRRVVVADFGHIREGADIQPVTIGLEVDPEDVDYPEEHNRNSEYPFMRHFGSGALGAIKIVAVKKT